MSLINVVLVKPAEVVHADFASIPQYGYTVSDLEDLFQMVGNVDDSQAALLDRLNDIEQVLYFRRRRMTPSVRRE